MLLSVKVCLRACDAASQWRIRNQLLLEQSMRVSLGCRRVGLLTALPSMVLAMCWQATPAQADDPPFIGWSAALPAISWQFDRTSADECEAGRVSCVEKTIREMKKRFDPLAAQCAHSAVFALAYLRTTETYLRTAQAAGFYSDPAFVNHEDAAFAAMYFTAYDDWAGGRVSRVPPAWRVALNVGADRRVTGTGDLLLGMNAHVNRDLPFVLASIGLVAADGSSRKPDHDKVNAMLDQVVQPLIAEEAARFKPRTWRLCRRRTASGLHRADADARGVARVCVAASRTAGDCPDPAARARVAEAIEQHAVAEARGHRGRD